MLRSGLAVTIVATLLLLAVPGRIAAQSPPAIPIGWDAYRQWEKWPMLRLGVRAYMRSTYDRRGGNEGADASHFLYQTAEDNNVTLDVESPGVLYFVRTNHWHGSPWRYVVDGIDHLISESSSADPDHPVENSTFLPAGLFSEPLAYTWSSTRGADLNWTPIAFERSFKMAYSRTHYGTGYYIWHQFAPGVRLTRPLASWKADPPDKEAAAVLLRAGTDLAPTSDSAVGRRLAVQEERGMATVAAGGSTLLLKLTRNDAELRSIALDVPEADALRFGRVNLRITWDERNGPSVDAPIALFFGAGILYNRDHREFLVKAFPVSVRYSGGRVHLACYFPMPFRHAARIELVNSTAEPVANIRWSVRSATSSVNPNHLAYFHATYRDHPAPIRGQDLVLLDTHGAEGSESWSGHLVGTSWIFSHSANLSTLEGDPRFFFDDSLTPQAQGTGTEEWGGGGDYWGGLNMTLPLAGHPTGARGLKESVGEEDKIESAYRFLLADLMPFGRNAVIRLEHGGTNESTEHYETVTYWYGNPKETLVKTDELHVGDAADEASHAYQSTRVSAPYTITSRYEWGPDKVGDTEIYPAHTDTGRAMRGESTFRLKIDPRNLGVMLRRKLDYAFPNQKAEVFVADSAGPPRWRRAGIWYLAGSNTCVYSNPRRELGPAQHIAQTSNRRFRDDEFLLPISLTRRRRSIRIRVVYMPVNRPLYPGYPIPELAWSEIRYTAYSVIPPN